MAKIAVVGVGNVGQRLAESLQDKMPDADFMVINHFDTGETSAVTTRLNTRLKRTLTADDFSKYAECISKLKSSEQIGDTYWWYASKFGRPAYINHMLHEGIALVRDEVIVANIRTYVLASSYCRHTQNPLERWSEES